MAPQPSPGDRTPRTPAPRPPPSSPSSQAPIYSSTTRKCIVLVDWWLERKDGEICISGRTETPQIRDGSRSSKRNIGTVTRLFKGVIKQRYDSFSVETSGGSVLINGPLNESKLLENGFSQKVYRAFRYGIPMEWKNKLDDPSMEDTDEHPDSPLEPVDPAVVEYYLNMILSDSYVGNRKRYSSSPNYPGSSASSNPATSKCCKTSVKTEDVSGEDEARTLRSGRVLGGSLSTPMTGSNKQKRMQQKSSNNRGLANEALSSTAVLTSHENSPSVSGSVSENKLQLHDSHGKAKKKARRKGSL